MKSVFSRLWFYLHGAQSFSWAVFFVGKLMALAPITVNRASAQLVYHGLLGHIWTSRKQLRKHTFWAGVNHQTSKEACCDGAAVWDNTAGHKHSSKEDRSSKSLHGAENEPKHDAAIVTKVAKNAKIDLLVRGGAQWPWYSALKNHFHLLY